MISLSLPFLVLSLFLSVFHTHTQALRCLRGKKRVEGKADRLYAQLETVKGILDRIASSQTDRLVKFTAILTSMTLCKRCFVFFHIILNIN